MPGAPAPGREESTMIHMRPSVPEDVLRQRELWALAFGDGGDYLDNFYQTYYRP